MRAWIVPLLGVVAAGLAATSVVTPFWTIQEQGRFFQTGFNATYEFGSYGWTYTYVRDGFPAIPDANTATTFDYGNETWMGPVVRAATALIVSGTGCAALGVALVLVRRLRTSLRPLRILFLGAGVVLLLAAAIVLLARLPPAANEDLFPPAFFLYGSTPVITGFWGSGLAGWLHGGAKVTYGAGWAWYALLAASGLLLVDAALLIRGHWDLEPARRPADKTPGTGGPG